MSEVFHESDYESNQESDDSSIKSSSEEDEQENEGETSSSDEGDDRDEVREASVARENGEVREEEDEVGEVELNEKDSTEVENVENAKKHVPVKPQVEVPKWNNERLYPPSSKCKSKAWQFGGFLKDSKTGQLLTQKTVCGFCGLKQN